MVCAPHRYIVRQMASVYDPLSDAQRNYGGSSVGSYFQTRTDSPTRYSGSDGMAALRYRERDTGEENRNYAIRPQRQYDFGAVRTPGIPSSAYSPPQRQEGQKNRKTKTASSTIDERVAQTAPAVTYRPMNRFEDYSFANARISRMHFETHRQSLAQRVLGELERLEQERPVQMQYVNS